MSLFENSFYQWRETFFVLMKSERRPSTKALQQALAALDSRYQIEGLRSDEEGNFEACTVFSPHDFAAMDIAYISGPEVAEQVAELVPQLEAAADLPEEQEKVQSVGDCDARLDVFHFEQMDVETDPDDEDEYMDPGSLLIVLERLAKLCHGVGVDPQSGAVV